MHGGRRFVRDRSTIAAYRTAADRRGRGQMPDQLSRDALAYHRLPVPGKLAISATKPLASQHDLSLAYSPGVAAACDAIAADPAEASNLTARSNLVAVVTNGTAVLGLGAIGPLAAKPVMEGKAVLFKKFSGIDVFDVEIDEQDPERFCDVVASLEPTFGGINIEDVKAPECFEIESRLRERMRIPVFHDDQHGTAIIVGAAVRNALELVGKSIGDVRLVASGAGAAALACLRPSPGSAARSPRQTPWPRRRYRRPWLREGRGCPFAALRDRASPAAGSSRMTALMIRCDGS